MTLIGTQLAVYTSSLGRCQTGQELLYGGLFMWVRRKTSVTGFPLTKIGRGRRCWGPLMSMLWLKRIPTHGTLWRNCLFRNSSRR